MKVLPQVADARHLRILQGIILTSLVLYFGRDILIPLSFAALISFVLYPWCKWMEKKGIGRMTAILINVSVLGLLLLGMLFLLSQQVASFIHEWPALKVKLTDAVTSLSRFFTDVIGISKAQQNRLVDGMANESASSVWRIVRNMVTVSTFSVLMLVLVPVYSVLILYYRGLWLRVLYRLFPAERRENILAMLMLTIRAYYNFIKGMALVYLIVGTLNSVGLLLLGVPHAILFGFVASILTFVPYIGIVIGSLLPITMAWLTYDSVWYPVGIVAIFAFVQYLEANVIFPVAVSNRLNVNTLVMLIAIFTGGILWGVAGMILFVPFIGILKLIADHNPRLRTLALALGTG